MEEIKVEIEFSGKHCHLTRETVDKLFGEGFELVKVRDLSQPGEFLSDQKVIITGPKGRSEEIKVVGPCRKADQVELARTDAAKLGIKDCPVRESGKTAGTPGIKITAVDGTGVTLDIDEGVIVAKRHVHFTADDGLTFGIKDGEIIMVRVEGERALIFDEVVARVSEKYATYMHIDIDEQNAAGLVTQRDAAGEIINPIGVIIKK